MAFRRRYRRGSRKRFSRRFRKRGHKKRTYKYTKIRAKEMPDSISVKLTKTYLGSISLGPSDTVATTPVELIGVNHFGDSNAGVYTPVNYASYANQYMECAIMGSKVNVSFLNNAQPDPTSGSIVTAGSGKNVICGLYPRNEQAGPDLKDIKEFMEQPRTRWKTLSGTSGQPKAFLKNYVSTRAMAGHAVDQNEDYKVLNGYDANGEFNSWGIPNEPIDWQLYIGPASGAAFGVSDTINYVATVDYYCKFENKIDVARSFVHA